MTKSKTPFNHIDAIFTNQRIDYYDTLNDADKKTFNIYVINMGISMNPRYVLYANEMNKYWDEIGPREVYLFYSQLLPKGKQYSKWIKSKKQSVYEEWVIEKISKYFEASSKEAITYLDSFYNTVNGQEELRSILQGFGIDSKKLKKIGL